MTNFVDSVREIIRSEDAPTMIEYGFLLALIALVVAGAALTLGTNVKSFYTVVAGSI
jgi:Flp pilus assembly pilin Flp